MAENSHGGKRTGSGRKPKDPTTTINFRVPVDKVNYLKPLVSTYIKGLLNPNAKPEDQTPEPVKKETPIKKSITPNKKDDSKRIVNLKSLLEEVSKEKK